MRRAEYARRNYFDVWLPELAPSPKWVKWALSQPWTDGRWDRYVKAYRREMQQPARRRLLQLLARLSRQTDFSVACYCEREDRCHRAILQDLLIEHGAEIAPRARAAAPKMPREKKRSSRGGSGGVRRSADDAARAEVILKRNPRA